MPKQIEYTSGQIVGELEFVNEVSAHIYVIKKTGKETKVRVGNFRCGCGDIFSARIRNVTSKNTTRCAKCAKKSSSKSIIKHGHAKSSTKSKPYRAWSSIQSRCHNPNNTAYKDYGKRGICVDDFWRISFNNFLIWWNLQDLYDNPKATIDRIKNDEGYSPTNCRLISMKEQSRNKRSNVWMTNGSDVLCLTDVARVLNKSTGAIYKHIRRYGDTLPYKGWRKN